MEEVFIVFEEQQLSCDRDYNEDGFTIVWDSEEVGRNLTTSQLIEGIGKLDEGAYQAVINYLSRELGISYGESSKDLDDNYFEDVYEFLEKEIGGGVFYRIYYQNVSVVKEVHKTEESAKKAVEYYTKECHYMEKFYHCRFRLIENKPRVTNGTPSQNNKKD